MWGMLLVKEIQTDRSQWNWIFIIIGISNFVFICNIKGAFFLVLIYGKSFKCTTFLGAICMPLPTKNIITLKKSIDK